MARDETENINIPKNCLFAKYITHENNPLYGIIKTIKLVVPNVLMFKNVHANKLR